MNFNDLTNNQPNINKLKEDLESFCVKYAITKFESDDIVELLEDGEAVDWIVDQLRAENAELDVDSLSSMLTDINTIVGPAEKQEEEEVLEEEEYEIAEAEEPAVEPEMDAGMPDLSQLDLSQLGDLTLPPGMQLPPGMDMKQIEKVMQSPQGKFMADFSIFCQEKGLDDIEATLTDPTKVEELKQEWMSMPRQAFEGKTPADMLSEDPSLMPQKVETYRRETPRVGRNDPCPCGSGKKFKKCCGRGN